MKHRTSELTGVLLDAAVALAEGPALPDFWRDPDDGTCWVRPGRELWEPSIRWEQAGPIMDREFIDTAGPNEFDDDERWFAGIYRDHARRCSPRNCEMRGETRLIAAMRAFVALKLGEEVELP